MRNKIITILIFSVAFLCIQMGFEVVGKQVEKFNNTELEINIIDGQSDNENVTVTMNIEKYWNDYDVQDNILCGAQYDGDIINSSDMRFHDWTVELHLSEEAKIDSLWNGEYVYEGDILTLTPMDYNIIVEEQNNQTFGFVAISKNLLKIDNIKLFGYFEMTIQDSKMYWVLQVVRIIWAISLICYIVVQICLLSYKRRQKRDEKIILQTMDTFISFIDAKDAYTHGHSERVAIYTREIANRLGLDKEVVKNYFYIALMHDCGKIGVPNTILNKPEKLSNEERKVIESHTKVGADILKNFTAIPGIQDGALHHHERYDGNGYPNKLKGNEISLVGRILCVADAFDAMNSDRVYRKKLPMEKIISELEENSGKQFDPEIVAHMLNMINDGTAERLIAEQYTP